MTKAWANGQWQTYTYDASGQRVKRSVNGVETWQVYGSRGELGCGVRGQCGAVESAEKSTAIAAVSCW